MPQATIGAENFLSDLGGTVTATSEAAGFPKENAYDRRSFTPWKPTGTAAQELAWDAGLGNAYAADYVGLFSHDLGTQGARLRYQSADDAAFTVNLATHVDVNPVADDLILFRSFTAGTARRYHRFYVTGHAAAFSIAVAAFGRKVEFPYSPQWQGFDPLGEAIIGERQTSETGNHLGSAVKYVQRVVPVDFRFLPRDSFVYQTAAGGLKWWWDNHAIKLEPFFWGWNAGNPGSYEKHTLWATLRSNAALPRRFATPTGADIDVQFEVVGAKE